jgi:sugar lactone lactonase YvrE
MQVTRARLFVQTMRNQQMSARKFLTMIAVVILTFVVAETSIAHPATGIVVDRKGQIYFSDLETIWKIDSQGKLTAIRAGLNGRHVHELSIDAQDNVYGADISYAPATQKWISSVWKITPEGKVIYLQEESDHPAPGISIWFDRAGNMYSIDQNNHTKTRTLLLRRTPEGVVSTLAGSAYGHADGKGTAARFGSVGGMSFGGDGSLYLTDGAYVRRVTLDGDVTTLAKDLTLRTSEDKPTLFGGLYGSLTGLTVDSGGNVYVADAGNRRLLKVSSEGKVSVVYRVDPPYFPNGVFATPSGDVYVMEVGLTLPNTSFGPRVRRISPDGTNQVIVTVAEENAGILRGPAAQSLGVATESTLRFFLERTKFVVLVSALMIASTAAFFMWRRRRRKQA